ncbi:DUF397 domain-containing protein [Nocardiopsis lambiniae]|uniref:DUF397 domain-containing protein n=1 Tax=Nocardiopsis lambiniae TaxID=3075539 RepID=A0ABU2M884_9ACTN|nr:DUF397 domain-containing protein [Nocardiopsis sp. DSM 44743]MDT0328370.1 DUF397 domain-containing protein [Nocardiopsis sp. DSM 44743]
MNDSWSKSSYSPNSGNCVECRWTGEAQMRDTKNREAGRLAFSGVEWAALLNSVAVAR